jgi:hypothetical protein
VANGTLLVAPSRVFARLRVDLAPIAFELPSSLSSRSQILHELGMKEAPSPADLVGFLQVWDPLQPPQPLHVPAQPLSTRLPTSACNIENHSMDTCLGVLRLVSV